jgi:energy-coupling factor transport system ATP-binding protein
MESMNQMKEQPIIAIDGLTYRYQSHQENDITAVNNMTLDIKKGEFICIIGHNGSGKSTLARHINALLRPTNGTVWVKGMNTMEDEHIWDIRQVAGMIFQNPDNQIVSAVVEDDVSFAPENLGVEPTEIRRRVDAALEQVRLGQYAHKSPAYLSGGQKQRLAIAGILAMAPEIIVLDEATAMLDPQGRKEIMEIIQSLNEKENMTIVHITHYMEEAIKADKVFVVEQGNIILQGTPAEVFSKADRLRAAKLELPDIVDVAQKLQALGIHVPDNVLTVEDLVEILCR